MEPGPERACRIDCSDAYKSPTDERIRRSGRLLTVSAAAIAVALWFIGGSPVQAAREAGLHVRALGPHGEPVPRVALAARQ